MENLKGGDLFTYLEKRNFELTEKRAKNLSHQIATALYYLHSFGVAHRDLKPENILMVSDDDESDLKIVDFGLAATVSEESGRKLYSGVGSSSYSAPEVRSPWATSTYMYMNRAGSEQCIYMMRREDTIHTLLSHRLP